MSIVARLSFDRSDRVDVVRDTTLRSGDTSPVDVVLDNLSATGCLINTDRDLSIGSTISVGLPGVGACFATIVRCDRPLYGCQFVHPISQREMYRARSAETVLRTTFPAHSMFPAHSIACPGPMIDSPASCAETGADQQGLSLAARFSVIVGASVASWALLATLFERAGLSVI